MKEEQQSEQEIQEAVATWSRREGLLFHGDTLGLLRGWRGGMRAKAAGSRKGWPDLVYILRGPRVVYIELKKKRGGHLSLEQKGVHKEMRDMGVEVHTVYAASGVDGVRQVRDILMDKIADIFDEGAQRG